jgi:hypothetical protein
MKDRLLEGLSELLVKQQEVTSAIAGEKAGLRPYLDQWEALAPPERETLRAGRPGEILASLEEVAQAIHARHQDWFGSDAGPTPGPGPSGAPASGDAPAGQPDLTQLINLYRAQQ